VTDASGGGVGPATLFIVGVSDRRTPARTVRGFAGALMCAPSWLWWFRSGCSGIR